MLATDVREVEAVFTNCRSEILRLQNELSRIGRVFRDYWLPEIMAQLAADPQAPQALNYRNSGRSMAQWLELGTALWRLHNLLDPDPPDLPGTDPSTSSDDVANICTLWLSGGNSSTAPLNEDTYALALALSRLGHAVYQACQRYEIKIKAGIDALPAADSTDTTTGRTRARWQDMHNAMTNYWRVIFNDLSTEGYGYDADIIAF